MGVHRHWLGDPLSISLFRKEYKVPANVEVRPDGPDDGITYSDGWMPFWLVSVVEGGVRFPLHPLLRECLREWGLSPCQLLPNGYKIIMGAVRLNEILSINLGVSDIEEAYDLCKSAEGHTYYLRLRLHRTAFVTALEDSYKYAGEDRVFVRGAWEFGEAEPSTTARIPRKIGVPPSFRQRRELARRNRWKVNSEWHEKVRKYRGHHCRAAYSLLGYTPHYKSFIVPRRVTGIDSVLHGESTEPESVQAEVSPPETVTVAIPSGTPVESGGQSPVRELAAARRADTGRKRQRQKFVVSSESRSTSSSEESEVEMLRGRRKRFVAEDLAAAAFGEMGESSVPSRGADVPEARRRRLLQRSPLPRPRRFRKLPTVLNQEYLLQPRDATLEEEARKKEDLLAELDATRALAEHLKEEAKQAVDQNVQLSWKLDEVRLASSRREEDMKMLRGTNSRLISERKLAERKLEMALDGKATELARALKDQEAKLKEEYLAEHESVMNEEVSKLAADYKAQLPGIREKAWALGWKAALRRVGVPPDSPIFQNSPRFPRSDSELRAVSGIAPVPSASEVPPAPAAPAPPAVPEAAPTVPSESAAGTNCNKGAAAP
ncbi:hypothetical protein AAC387_Pa02g4303 [Persea americana]